MSELCTLKQLGDQVVAMLKAEVPLLHVKADFERYTGEDWKEYCNFCTERYQRNIAYTDSDLLDIVVICWSPEQGSPPHDHPEGGCLVKVASGRLEEELFTSTPGESKEGELILKSAAVRSLETGGITYQQGARGIHIVRNVSPDVPGISIHLYSPSGYRPKVYEAPE